MYNQNMEKSQNKKQDFLLTVTAYITLVTVAIGTLLSMSGDVKKGLAIIIFIAIGVVMGFQKWANQNKRNIEYLSLLTVLTTLLYFLNTSPGIYLVIFFIISVQAMMLLPVRWGIAWIALLSLISWLSFVFSEGWLAGLVQLGIYGGGYLFFGIIGRLFIEANDQRERSEELLAELQETHQQLQEYVERVEELAVTKERNRLAREMHDSLGHRLTVAAVQLEGAQRIIPADPDKAAEMVGTVRQQVREALAELRQTVATLREPIETGLSIQQALQRLAASFEGMTNLEINLQIDEMPKLSALNRHILYRTVQEALTNIQRHAGASQVWLHLTHQADAISLLIGDDGKGFPENAEEQGFGLRGIRERVVQAGGDCAFEQRRSGGAKISVRLPVVREENDE